MKIYIASSNPLAASHVATVLKAQGLTITSPRHDKPFEPPSKIPTDERVEIASEDRGQILQSDGLVLIADPYRVPGDKFVEAGIAIGLNKPVVILGPAHRENIMLYLPGVFQVEKVEDIAPLFKPADNTIPLDSSDLSGTASDEPPAGKSCYRPLVVGDRVEQGDEYRHQGLQAWTPACMVNMPIATEGHGSKYRRKVEPPIEDKLKPNPDWVSAPNTNKFFGWSPEKGWEEFDPVSGQPIPEASPVKESVDHVENGVAYRLLTRGEIIKAGDQFLGCVGWWNNTEDVGRTHRGGGHDFQYRRKVEVPAEKGPSSTYRILDGFEIMRVGDEIRCRDHGEDQWAVIHPSMVGNLVTPSTVRRKVEDRPVNHQWPLL